MNKNYLRMALLFCLLVIFLNVANAAGRVKGIYVTQWSLENTAFVNYLIQHAKASGIDTFIVDLEFPSKRYHDNIELLKQNNLNYVARIIVFPNGGTPESIKNPAIWQKKYDLVKLAVEYGAKQIQLDYIRYSSKQKASTENAQDILTIIRWYKSKLIEQKIPLQIDVFGITSFGESKHIGQNIKLFSEIVDAICPMVYPSHYVPFAYHFERPYETILESLTRIKKMFQNNQAPMKIYAYIELSNYHYPMSRDKTLEYIKAQIKAVADAGVDGWYAWSPHNRYDNLFRVLQGKQDIQTYVPKNKAEGKQLGIEETQQPNKQEPKKDEKQVSKKDTKPETKEAKSGNKNKQLKEAKSGNKEADKQEGKPNSKQITKEESTQKDKMINQDEATQKGKQPPKQEPKHRYFLFFPL